MDYLFGKSLTRYALLLSLLGLLTTFTFAQAGTGEVTGLVSDPSGAVVANATVILTNSATGEKRTTVTTPAGAYRFSALPIVGTYTLETTPKGFKGVKVANIVVSVGTVVTQDVKLELGQGSEQVTVEAGAEVVQTTESSISTLVDRRTWQSMPLEVRNQNSFIELVAGAVPQDGTSSNRGAEVNGTRSGAGSYLVEGSDNNDQGQGGRGQLSLFDKGGAATSISPDAIQEYRVITNSYSAEYGKGGGFITDTVLKSGTNQWHGSAFEYNRIQALTAQDFFSNRADQIDHLVRNQFGGSLGGPIVKDKTFFFGAGELHRARQTLPLTGTGTTGDFLNFVQSGALETWAETDPNGLCNNQAWRDSVFAGAVLNGLNTPTMSPTAAPCPGALNLSSTTGPIFNALHSLPSMHYPLATSGLTNTANGLWTGQFLSTPVAYPVPVYGTVTVVQPQNQNEERFSFKVDHRFSQNDTLSVGYLYQNATSLEGFFGGNNAIGPDIIQDGRGQNISITWNHTFTPTLLNTFRVGYLRHRSDFPAPAGTADTPAYFTNDGMSVDLGLGSGLPQFFTENQFQYIDTLSIVHGKHSFKAGGEYRRIRNGSTFNLDKNQTIGPWGIEDTLTDLAFSDQLEEVIYGAGVHHYGGAYYVSASLDPTTATATSVKAPDFYRGFRANEMAGFVQDDYRVSSRLTVNLGLRYEYFGVPHNFKPGIDSNFYFGANVTPVPTATANPFFPVDSRFYAGVATGNFQIRDHELWNKDTNNFSPRAGFAWDLFGNQKFVIRAGAGIMYDRIYNNVFENIRFNPPFFSDNLLGAFQNGQPIGPVSSPGLVSFPFTDASRVAYLNGFAPTPNPRHMDQNIVTPYYEQAHVGFQWEFAKGYVVEPEYVGTFGHKLLGLSDINTFNGRLALGTACVAPTDPACRINPNVAADNFRSNGYDSNYHAVQVKLTKAYASGLTFSGSYTYSKALDDVSDLFLNGAAARPTDNMNHKADYGAADFDTRHRMVATVSYDLPFLRQNRWVGGWGINSIISYQTGHPWSPFSSAVDLNKDGYRTDRVISTTGKADSTYLNNSPADGTLNPNLWVPFTCPASENGGLWCDSPAGRNSAYGPKFANVDFNVTKRFRITEGSSVSFQANFFDLFNHPNFLNPTSPTPGAGSSMNIRAADFSASRQTAGDSGGHRVTQLALRFDF